MAATAASPTPQPISIAVIGGGSFGSALAHLAARNGHKVTLWARNKDIVRDIAANHRNEAYLPGLTLAESICASEDLQAAVAGAQLVFVAVPSSSFRDVCAQAVEHLLPQTHIVSTTKGIEDPGFLLMSQVLERELQKAGRDNPLGVLSGPNLAREIVADQYAGTVIASRHEHSCELVRETLSSDRFRVYSSADVFGVELGGALKNIYAIVLGMAAGTGVGKNTEGLLLTRSVAEMCRFAMSMDADPATFLGLAGIGDLFATCTSPLSRNFTLGVELAQGSTLQQAQQKVEQSAEGVNTIRLVSVEAAKRGVSMPLVEALSGFLFEGFSLQEMVDRLMSRMPSEDVQSAISSLRKPVGD